MVCFQFQEFKKFVGEIVSQILLRFAHNFLNQIVDFDI